MLKMLNRTIYGNNNYNNIGRMFNFCRYANTTTNKNEIIRKRYKEENYTEIILRGNEELKLSSDNKYVESIILTGEYNTKFNENTFTHTHNLKNISSYGEYNNSIEHIPKYVETLTLHGKFNLPVDLRDYKNLKYLVLGNHFNQELNNLLPHSLQGLTIGNAFNYNLDLSNQKYLEYIDCNCPHFNKEIIYPKYSPLKNIYLNSNDYNYNDIPYNYYTDDYNYHNSKIITLTLGTNINYVKIKEILKILNKNFKHIWFVKKDRPEPLKLMLYR